MSVTVRFCAISYTQQLKQALAPYALEFTAMDFANQYTVVTIKEEILYGRTKCLRGLSTCTTSHTFSGVFGVDPVTLSGLTDPTVFQFFGNQDLCYEFGMIF